MTERVTQGGPAFIRFICIAELINWAVFGLCSYLFHYKQITGISEMETMLSVGVVLHIAVTAGFYTAFIPRFDAPDDGEIKNTVTQILTWLLMGVAFTWVMFPLLFILIPKLDTYGSEYDGFQYLFFGLLFHGGFAAAMIVLRIGRCLKKALSAKK